jgi:hypothetical protein
LVKKAAGAYTVAGVTSALIGWGTVADNIPACPWTAPSAGLLVAAGVQTDLGCTLLHNGVAAGVPFGVAGNVAALDGKPLALRTTGASPAAAGGDLTVKLYYELVPSASLIP